MVDCFKFVEQQAGNIGSIMEPGNQMDESRSDEIRVQDVISSVRLLHKAIVKKDEKIRQMRYGGNY